MKFINEIIQFVSFILDFISSFNKNSMCSVVRGSFSQFRIKVLAISFFFFLLFFYYFHFQFAVVRTFTSVSNQYGFKSWKFFWSRTQKDSNWKFLLLYSTFWLCLYKWKDIYFFPSFVFHLKFKCSSLLNLKFTFFFYITLSCDKNLQHRLNLNDICGLV